MPLFAFTTPVHLRTISPTRSTCPPRRPSPPTSMADEWGTPKEWQTSGQGVPQKGLQQIEFIIRQDGRVEEKVLGIKGQNCVKLTERIEEALGTVLATEETEEFYEQPIEISQDVQVIQKGDPLYVDDPTITSW